MADTERRARVERLLQAARCLVDPNDAAGGALRWRLQETTRLSRENIELGLTRCLETSASEADWSALLEGATETRRAHVLLSGNVFVAPLRAIALGLAASSEVHVRASRRDPALAEALHELLPGLFRFESELMPRSGDDYFAYGADETLTELREALPRGVRFHAHGSGFGAVVLDAPAQTPLDARAVALDTALFDQRGCLSPRVVCVVGDEADARQVARWLAAELAALEREVPRGPRSELEAAAERRERDAAAYAFELFEAGSSWLSLSSGFVLPPARRCLHVTFTDEPLALLEPFSAQLTCIGTNSELYRVQLSRHFEHARVVALGEMQRPPLDGPVDRRASPSGELLR